MYLQKLISITLLAAATATITAAALPSPQISWSPPDRGQAEAECQRIQLAVDQAVAFFSPYVDPLAGDGGDAARAQLNRIQYDGNNVVSACWQLVGTLTA